MRFFPRIKCYFYRICLTNPLKYVQPDFPEINFNVINLFKLCPGLFRDYLQNSRAKRVTKRAYFFAESLLNWLVLETPLKIVTSMIFLVIIFMVIVSGQADGVWWIDRYSLLHKRLKKLMLSMFRTSDKFRFFFAKQILIGRLENSWVRRE